MLQPVAPSGEPHTQDPVHTQYVVGILWLILIWVTGPHGDGLLVAGLFFTDYLPSWEKIPPVEDPGLCDPLGEPGWLSW